MVGRELALEENTGILAALGVGIALQIIMKETREDWHPGDFASDRLEDREVRVLPPSSAAAGASHAGTVSCGSGFVCDWLAPGAARTRRGWRRVGVANMSPLPNW